MSVVVGVCGEDFFTLVADSRITKYSRGAPAPLDEHFKKVFRINENVIFAMTGRFLDDDEIHRPFEGLDATSIDVDTAANTIMKYYKGLAPHYPLNQSYIVGGKNQEGLFVAYNIRYEVDKAPTIERWQPTGGHAFIVALPPALSADGDKYKDAFGACIATSTMHDEMVRKIGIEIAKIAAVDTTVNTNIQTLSVF